MIDKKKKTAHEKNSTIKKKTSTRKNIKKKTTKKTLNSPVKKKKALKKTTIKKTAGAAKKKRTLPVTKTALLPHTKRSSVSSQTKKNNNDFILEVGIEEMPAGYIQPAAEELFTGIKNVLDEGGLTYADAQWYATPRRLIVVIHNILMRQPDRTIEKQGPSKKAAFDNDKNPTKAALGFARSLDLKIEDIEVRETAKGAYLFGTVLKKGQPTNTYISERLPEIIKRIHFPKSMYWNATKETFARPIRSLGIVLGERTVPVQYAGIAATNMSRGHYILSPKKFRMTTIHDYLSSLRAGYVEYDPKKRSERIRTQISKLVNSAQQRVALDEQLLMTVTYLTEWPLVQVGTFNADYLNVPEPILVMEMKQHQKYFPIYTPAGKLDNSFIMVTNGIANTTTQQGNERVLSARLNDARFFFQEDTKEGSLEAFNKKLESVVYLRGYGTLADKVRRLEKAGAWLAHTIQRQEDDDISNDVCRAALLCKADLASNAVYEFPELQGVIGGKYAEYFNESFSVARAISEHYLPSGADDLTPSTDTGAMVALADKLDSLIGCFAYSGKPGGSADPYGIRRAINGIIQIILEKSWNIQYSAMIDMVIRQYNDTSLNNGHTYIAEDKIPQLKKEIIDFTCARLKTAFADKGLQPDEINAIVSAGWNDIYDAFRRIKTLHEFRRQPEFENLITALKRMANITKEVKEKLPFHPELVTEGEHATKVLYTHFIEQMNKIRPAIKSNDYQVVFQQLATFRKPVDRFFDEVLVMVDDEGLRNNRLALLQSITMAFKEVIDFSLIVIAGERK